MNIQELKHKVVRIPSTASVVDLGSEEYKCSDGRTIYVCRVLIDWHGSTTVNEEEE